MGIKRIIICLLLVPRLVSAEIPAMICSGFAPDWQLKYNSAFTEFTFAGRTSEMTIPQMSIAEGADWPIAATLIAPRDSAVVIFHNRSCDGRDFEAQILTQRGETPLLLTGCCDAVSSQE